VLDPTLFLTNPGTFPLLEGFKIRNGLQNVKQKSLRARILEAKPKEILFHAQRDSTFRKLNLTGIVKEFNYRDALSVTRHGEYRQRKERMDEGITEVGNYHLYEVDRDPELSSSHSKR